MVQDYDVFLSVEDGLYVSYDGGDSWNLRGPSKVHPEEIVKTANGDIFGVNTHFPLAGETKGLCVLRNDELYWRPTLLVDEYQADTGLMHMATGALALLSESIVLAATGAGVWACAQRGEKCYPIGPYIKKKRGWFEFRDRLDFGDVPNIETLVISRSGYGDVNPAQYPLILAGSFKKMYWCRWGDGAQEDGSQSWFRPYPAPDDWVTRLVEFGDNVAAWTRSGVFVNWDARHDNWEKIDRGNSIQSHTPLLACAVSPDGKKVFCANGNGTMFTAEYDLVSSELHGGGQPQINSFYTWLKNRDSAPLSIWQKVWADKSWVCPPVFSPNYSKDHTAFTLCGSIGLLKSTDGGICWQPSNGKGIPQPQDRIWCFPRC